MSENGPCGKKTVNTAYALFNATGEDCHGFEIERHRVSSRDVLYTFGGTYQRCEDPTVEDFPGGVYVRYKSAYDPATGSFVQTTPKAPAVISPTDGHACWTGGASDYLTSGCEHFGMQLRGNATRTIYRWLVADPATPGAPRASGSVVSIPAPIWNVQAPPPDAPDPVNPVVGAVMEPEPPRDRDYGDAVWVQVFKTETSEPAELDHLLSDEPAVPDDPAETETEWQLLQPSRKKPNKLENAAQIAEGNESVTRRYEFYQYTGPYDPENHEAQPVDDSAPLESEIGNYIGAQMVAINLGIDPLPAPCAGDCNDDGAVTFDDIVVAVNVVLGVGPVDTCATVDASHDGAATIDELIAAVNHALGGC